jgi:hypothetical protein
MAIPLWAMTLMQGAGKQQGSSTPSQVSDLSTQQSAQAAGVSGKPSVASTPQTAAPVSNTGTTISDMLSKANVIHPYTIAFQAGSALKSLRDTKKRQRKFDRIAEIARENEASDRAYGLQQRSDRDATGDMQKVLALQEYLKSLNARRV